MSYYEVRITDILGDEVAIVRIEQTLDNTADGVGDFAVQTAVSDSTHDHFYQTYLYAVRKDVTPLGLLLAALSTLPKEAFQDGS